MENQKTVLITGVSGYIGSWCAHLALEKGYTVVGTVRNPDAKKATFLRNAIAGKRDDATNLKTKFNFSEKAASNLTLVSADLLAGDEFWDEEIFAKIKPDYVLHTASPYFGREPDDPQEYIRPAVEGTTSVMKAAIKHNVQRVTVTSSVAAVVYPNVDGKTYTPSDWSDYDPKTMSQNSAYEQSKTLAERAAWDLVEGTDMTLNTICPMFVIGPTLYSPADNAATAFESGDLCVKIMQRAFPMLPHMRMGISDVRDVAEAHLLTLSTPEAKERRFILTEKCLWFVDIVRVFSEAKPELGIPVRTAPSLLIKFMGLWNADMKRAGKDLDADYNIDSSATKEVLGLEWTPSKDSAGDMMDDMIALGAV